jgi:thiol-disulfide isomerase/thioredoxin
LLFGIGLLAGVPDPKAALVPPMGKLSALTYEQQVLKPHRGKVVVVNFWASFCAPCLEEIPRVQGALKPERDVALVFVSADAPTEERRARDILTSRGISLSSYIVSDADPTALIRLVDAGWGGQVPYTVIYDREGNRAVVLDGEQSAAELSTALKRVLAKPSNGVSPPRAREQP